MFAASTALMWATIPVMLKSLVEGLDPYTITCFRFFVSTGMLMVVVFRKRGIRSTIRAARSSPILLILSTLGVTGSFVFYLLSLNHLSPGTSQVLIQLAPIFMVLGGLLLFKEPFAVRQWIGLGILLSGLILFFNQRYAELLGGSDSLVTGVVLVLVSAVALTTYALAQKQLLTVLPTESTLVLVFLFGTLLLLPLSEPSQLLWMSPYQGLLLCICAFSTPLSYFTFARALDHLEASRVSVVLHVNPLITISEMTLLTALFPGLLEPEHLNVVSILGAVGVVGGAILVSLSPAKDTGVASVPKTAGT